MFDEDKFSSDLQDKVSLDRAIGGTKTFWNQIKGDKIKLLVVAIYPLAMVAIAYIWISHEASISDKISMLKSANENITFCQQEYQRVINHCGGDGLDLSLGYFNNKTNKTEWYKSSDEFWNKYKGD